MLSVLDLFRIGIGPSSSHTVGPIRIAGRFLAELEQSGVLARTERIEVELQGSLALTGAGHATPKAVMLGLLGLDPETLDPEDADNRVAALEQSRTLPLPDGRRIAFDPARDIRFAYEVLPKLHPNGMRLRAFAGDGAELADNTWYSTGGGFIASQRQLERPVVDDIVPSGQAVQFPFISAAELLAVCKQEGLPIDAVVMANEGAKRAAEATNAALDRIAGVMMACIDRGLSRTGTLPGSLKVRRRAPEIWQKLKKDRKSVV